MGNRPNKHPTSNRNCRLPQLCRRGLIALLALASALASSAQVTPPAVPTVQLSVQLNWSTQAIGGHPLVATVVLEPTDHSGVARKLQLDTKSAAVVELELGRYQLTTTAPLAINHRAYGWNIELALFDHANFVRLSQENAVRLEIGDIIEPASIKLTTAKALTPKGEGSVPVHARSQIIALLDRWASSIRARDLRMQMSCYAPELVRYLQQQNVSWAEVKRRKQRQLQLYSRVRQIALSDINLSIGEGHAFGTALTKWTFTDADVESRGTALVNFEFAQIGSRWLITSEWQQVVSPQASRKAVQASSLQTP